MKYRAGWNDDDWSPCAWHNWRRSGGLQAVALHPRTREQGFAGAADWRRIAEVKAAVKIR